MQMVRTQWDRVWILCLHKWSPTADQQVRRPFFLENSGTKTTKERIVFEQEVGLTDFTFCLIKTWIQSPLKLALHRFLKGDKG